MKCKRIMRVISLLAIVITIFLVVLYEPNIENINNFEDKIIETTEDNVKEPYLSTDKEILQEKNSDILTLNLDSIVNSLTLDEKNIVKGILNKLSVIDCAKINSILNNDSVDSNNEAMKYIKKRLVGEDYIRLEGILNQYIDLM